MLKPLDYLFEALLLVMFLYNLFLLYKKYIQTNTNADDGKLMERYIKLERLYDKNS